jgi:hypothetical protein
MANGQLPMINVGGNVPPEILQQQQALNRQQQMAQLLMQQGQQMPSGQMVSGRYVAPSFFQYAAPLAQMYAGTRLAEKGDKAQADLAKALRQQYANEMTQYRDLLRGKEATYEPDIPTETYETVKGKMISPAVPANPEAAYLFGSTAYNPALQQLSIKKLGEGPKWEKDVRFINGKEIHGWTNVNDPNLPFSAGTEKPALSQKDIMQGTYEGWYNPNAVPQTSVARGQTTQPVSTPTGQAVSTPMGQPTVGNQPTMTQASYTGGPAMSPQARVQANKEIYVDKAKRQQEYAEKAPAAINFMQDTINNINGLIGDAKVVKDPKTGKERIEYGKIAPHEGFNTAVGVSGITGGFGAAGFIPGTSTTDFKERFKQIGGQTFLAAYETIRGAGQITEQEGAKATAALNRMSLAQSEVEFIKAAREFEENVTKGMELARKRAGMPAQTQQGGWRVK